MTPTATIAEWRTLEHISPGDLIQVTPYVMGYVCWVELADGENTTSHGIGYLGTDGDYHERTAKEEYVVFLQHAVIGKLRHVESRAMAWMAA